jgi:hypothetical protein
MIEVFDAKNVFDLMYECAENQNCAYVYFYNKSLQNCTNQELISQVYDYYEEFLPEDLMLIIKTNQDNIIRFMTTDTAVMNATSWFPNKEQLGELPDEYYFKCYAVDSQGIFYEN